MHHIHIGFDKLSVYILETMADMRQVTFVDQMNNIVLDYIAHRPKLEELTPSIRFHDVRQRTYRKTSDGPNVRFPCRKTGYFDDKEWKLLEEIAGRPVTSSLLRQIATWWLDLPKNKELVDQLMERFEQQPAH